jgi:hypothetical protein
LPAEHLRYRALHDLLTLELLKFVAIRHFAEDRFLGQLSTPYRAGNITALTADYTALV